MEAASPTCMSVMGDASPFGPGDQAGPCQCLVKFEVQLYKVRVLIPVTTCCNKCNR